LVSLQQLCEVVIANVLDDHIPWDRVDSVIKITVQDANLMIHNHRSITAADKVVCPSGQAVLDRKHLGLENGCNVIVAVRRLRLPGC
jgi:hypothetical protein